MVQLSGDLEFVARSQRAAPRRRRRLAIIAAACALWIHPSTAHGDEIPAHPLPPAAPRRIDFQRDVQPILAEHCIACHGPAAQESNYRLDVRDAALGGADHGEPPIVPGNSGASPLIQLAARVRDDGLTMPPEDEGEPLSREQIAILRAWIDQGAAWPDALAGDAAARPQTDHWSFQPLQSCSPPPGDDPWIASPIDAFLLAKMHQQGLTPSPRADRRTLIRRLTLVMHGLPPTREQVDAFLADETAAAYDRLVDRILSSPHYGERWARHWLDVVRFAESTGFETNRDRPNAWPYRDYVIDALNQDKPYCDFVIEQIAGDALGIDAATGFLVGGANDIVKSPDIGLTLTQRQDELADIVGTTGAAFLGLTVGCARCHNHKFDPILQKDYYAMQAVFAGVEHGERPLSDLAEPGEQSNPVGYVGVFHEPAATHRLYRGDPLAPREVVAPDQLSVCGTLDLAVDAPEQQRRLALAHWIASPENPLTARVIVNRVWHYHFGIGIVATPSDFGKNGAAPSHPELLDWLAQQFIDHGWSLKWLHRQILSSSAYQQSSAPRSDGMAQDAQCRLLWRYPPRRLEAEAIRDCVLHASGQLNEQVGGPGYLLFDVDRENVYHYFPKQQFGPQEFRRMVYMTKIRQEQDSVFGVFDCPDGGQAIPQRGRSTTPLQALNLLNSRFMLAQAQRLAERLESEAGDRPEAQVRRAFELLFARLPDADELRLATAVAEQYGMAAVCRALLNANEFLFLS